MHELRHIRESATMKDDTESASSSSKEIGAASLVELAACASFLAVVGMTAPVYFLTTKAKQKSLKFSLMGLLSRFWSHLKKLSVRRLLLCGPWLWRPRPLLTQPTQPFLCDAQLLSLPCQECLGPRRCLARIPAQGHGCPTS